MELPFVKSRTFELSTDSEGLALVLGDHKSFEKAKRGSIDDQALQQLLTLRLLEEQGLAEEIGNGYYISSEIAVQLDLEVRDQLNLPTPWAGSFRLICHGQSFDPTFAMRLSFHRPDGSDAGLHNLRGPLVWFSDSECYLPTKNQWDAIYSIEQHRASRNEGRPATEIENLQVLSVLQEAVEQGESIDLGPFRELRIKSPRRVGVSLATGDDGSLTLTPSFGLGEDVDALGRRLGQIEGKDTGSIRLGNQIIVLDKTRMRAVKEVVGNRNVRQVDVSEFLKNPATFLDASLIDLDLGFSVRVKGATRFALAYFGETEASDIDWFDRLGETAKAYLGPEGARKLINSQEELARFREFLEDAVQSGATQFRLSEKVTFQFDDAQTVRETLDELAKDLETKVKRETASTGDQDEDLPTTHDPVVVDIEKSDRDSQFSAQNVPQSWKSVLDTGQINVDRWRFTPYRYQEEGIRWILGLAQNSFSKSDDHQLLGSLLADDMGLGKTFMSLAAIDEYYLRCTASREIARPVLVVAPLSLIEIWNDEVHKVFKKSPFRDIVRLQANADLPKYRVAGAGRETRQKIDALEANQADGTANIRYSLKLGKSYGPERLDMDRRLVLTTYDSMRDYQFSLCRIDWSFVIFDEAQYIKNPNALATRAAKGLKAKFRLLLTGTPVENELRDFWCIVDTARPGLLGAYQNFRATYVRPIMSASSEEKAEVRLAVGKQLRDAVGGLMLRRLKEDHLDGLPAKTIYVGADNVTPREVYDSSLKVVMEGGQLARYEAVISTTREIIESDEPSPGAALRGLHQLRAVSLHPDLLEGGFPELPKRHRQVEPEFRKSGKLSVVLKVLREIEARREKAIIFCISKNLQSFLQVGLSLLFDRPVHVINGDTKAVARKSGAKTRKILIEDFESAKGFAVIIMSPVAAGVGLTVVGANNVIHLERHWNPAKENQATDRVYRIGQNRPVNVYIPLLHHPNIPSFDVNLAKLLANKSGLRDAIVTPDVVTEEELVGAGVFGENISGAATPVDSDRIHSLGWQLFEALAAELSAAEHDAKTLLTPTKDYGCDVVVLSAAGEHRLIQCKHTTSGTLRGHQPIQEIAGARGYYETQIGEKFKVLDVYTNAAKFDADARNTAAAQNVNLVGLKSLKKMLRRHPVTDRDLMRRLAGSR